MNEKKEFRQSYEKNRIELANAIPLDTPLSVIIDTSEACNLKCNYCFRGNNALQGKQSYVYENNIMEWDVFTKIIDQLKVFPRRVKKIALSGHGEPLCNKKLPEMVEYIYENYGDCTTEIHTNASLLDEEYALRLAKSNITKINISLQGLDAEKYLTICKTKINYDKFLKSLAVLYHNKKSTTINIKIVDVALGDDEVLFRQMFSDLADGLIIEKVVPLWQSVDYDKVIGLENKEINKCGKKIDYQRCCSFVFYTMLISPSGFIYPCTEPMLSFNLGNIYDTTLKEAWDGQVRREFLIRHLQDGRSKIGDCKNCYIAQNSIMTKEDSLNGKELEILERYK